MAGADALPRVLRASGFLDRRDHHRHGGSISDLRDVLFHRDVCANPWGSGAAYLGGFYVLFLLILLGFLLLNRWCGHALEVPPGVRTDLQRWAPIFLNVYFFGWILAIPLSLLRFAAELQTVVR